MIITLCGSARFEKEFKEWNEKLTLEGHTVFSLSVYASDKPAGKDWYTEEQKKELDAAHKRKISASEAIVVLNVGGYFGDSTRSEIGWAEREGKKIFWLEDKDPAGISLGHCSMAYSLVS